MKSPFLVEISELRRERALPKPVEISERVEWGLELSRVAETRPIDASLQIVPVSGGFLVQGGVDAIVRHACYRCLTEWEEPVSVDVAQLVVEDSGDDEADYVVRGSVIDLEPILRDEILLAMPMRPACDSDRAGVVDGAKSGLNTDTPEDESDSASPFAVLRDLFDSGD